MPRRQISSDHYEALTVEERHVLSTLDDYATALGGFTHHVRDARRQNLEGLPDVMLWVPTCDHHHILYGAIEIKLRGDTASFAQHQVMDATRRIDRIVAEIVRVGARPKDGEIDLDELLRRLDDARSWE
jgi:hypothetical protein